MKKEQSFGIIPVKKLSGIWHLLLIRHGKGHWAFPKGHPEPHEKPQETALRELKEETGLEVVRFFPILPLQEHYFFTMDATKIEKWVIYYLAEVEGEVTLQESEVADYEWLKSEEAEEKATFSPTKALCRQVRIHLI